MSSLAVSRYLLLALFAALFALDGRAQNSAQVRVFAEPADAYFLVDGVRYRGSQSFVWATGSKHRLEADTLTQTSSIDLRFSFTDWKDNRGVLPGATNPVQTVTADPAITSYRVTYQLEFRIQFVFFSTTASPGRTDCTLPSAGATPFPGQLFVNGNCTQSSYAAYFGLGSILDLAAVPNPGFVFTGWLVNGAPPGDAFLRSYVVRGPASITPLFAPAKRVLFYTEPEGFQVSIDRSPFPTVSRWEDVGRSNPGLRELAVGARHQFSAPSPQQDLQGRLWVFESFDVPLGAGGLYEVVDSHIPQTITARFVRGANVSLLTQPAGLRLAVNGQDNWPSYNFVWAIGSTNTVAAPAITTDSRGRKYRFLNWSNGGPASQEIPLRADAADQGLRLTANYELMPRLIISTNLPASRLLVNGEICAMPCTLDGAAGSTVSLDASPVIELGADSRAEFAGWSDAGEQSRTVTFSGDERRISLNYQVSNRLRAVSDPADGSDFSFEPASPDGFYPAGATVRVTANARDGYRFRRWAGDLEGSANLGFVLLNSPQLVRALLDPVPTIPTAGVRNAAGETPDKVIAPGSIVSIFGRMLAPAYAAAPGGSPVQSLANTVVQWNNRMLPLLFVSPEQINAVAPSDLPDGEQVFGVRTGNQPVIEGKAEVVREAPGLFGFPLDDKIYGAATHEDGGVVSPDRPARRGQTVTLVGTGFGRFQRPLLDGFPAPPSPPNPLAHPVVIRIGGSTLSPLSAIASPGQVGLVAIRVLIPEDLPPASELPVTAFVNGRSSNTVLLPLR